MHTHIVHAHPEPPSYNSALIRRDMPRKSNISDCTRQDIEMLQTLINSTSRKCLDFKTPMKAFEENCDGALQM